MRSLESEDTDLERAVNLYAEGKKLVAQCEAQLKSAQQAIEAVNAPAAADRAGEDAPDDGA